MDKRAKRIDRLQNVTILVLLLSFILLLMQTPLFGETGRAALRSTVRGWFYDESAVTVDEEDVSLSSLAVPVRIVRSNDFMRCGADNVTTLDETFERAGAFLGEAIGSAQGGGEVSEMEFLAALRGAGLYFEFSDAVPLEILCARLGVSPPSAQRLDVQRCLLGAAEGDVVPLYLQSSERACWRFSTAVSVNALREYLDEQEGSGAEFAFALGEEYAVLSPYTLLLDELSGRSVLNAANALSDYPTEDLLRRAEFNPHTKTSYTETSGTIVVLESQRTLYLHPDGELSYTGGSAEINSVFSVSAADAAHPSRAEICSAARRLIAALTQGRTGDAALYVSGMTSESASVTTVTFDYMVGGTPLRFSDGRHAAEITVTGRSITEFSLRLRRYSATEQESLLLPLPLSLAIAGRYPGSELSVAYIDSYADTVSASWIAG